MNYGEGEPRGHANLPPSNPLVCPERGRTRQEDEPASNINLIWARYNKTRQLPLDKHPVFFDDVSSVGSFHEAMMRVHDAEESFEQCVSADVRSRFDNDISKFIDFTSDESNRDELIAMGLLKRPDGWKPSDAILQPPAQGAGEASAEPVAGEPAGQAGSGSGEAG